MMLVLFLTVTMSGCSNSSRPDHLAVNVGIHVPVFPPLVLVPGYPVYYDPRIDLNYFFYDGLYWVYRSDRWYASSWYNGPWSFVEYHYVPMYILRVPVRYYRQPPSYFRGWHADAPPRWDERWGRDWDRNRSDRYNDGDRSQPDRGDGRHAPEPAPVPSYQRDYSGERYPRDNKRQDIIRSQNYRYEPREPITQERFKQQGRGMGNANDKDGDRGGNRQNNGR